MATNSLPCVFCGARNDPAKETCIACGAPLELSRPAPVVTPVNTASDFPLADLSTPQPPVEPVKQQLKEGIAAVGAGLGLAGVGGLLMRTLAEALAIIIAALVVGFNAGRVSPFPGGWFLYLLLAVGGSAVVGVAVGSVIKRSVFVLFSAPFGALLGVGAAILLKLNTARTPWLPLFAIAGACLLALLGGRSNRTARFAGYQRFRPLLGAIGGIIFGLIGFGAGWIVH